VFAIVPEASQKPRPAPGSGSEAERPSRRPIGRPRVRLPRPSAPLALLLVLAALSGLAWSVASAPLTGPDEANHVAYAQLLAETGSGPSSTQGEGPYSTQLDTALQALNLGPIVGHQEGRPSWSRLSAVSRQLDALPPAARKNGTGPNAVANNPPLYYALEAVAYRLSPDGSLLARLWVMRLVSVVLFVVTVGLVWLIAKEVFAATWLRVLATGLVALQPKLAFLCSTVNPDVLLITLSTAFTLAALRLLHRGPSPGRVAALALAAGLAPLTHGRGFFVVPVAVLVLVIVAVRARPPLREALRLGALAAGIVLACVAVAFLYTRSHAAGAFGGEVGRAAEQRFNLNQFASYVFQFYFGPLPSLQALGPPYGYRQVFIETFYGTFGSLEVNFGPRIYDALQVGSAVGLALLGACVVRRWDAVRRAWPVVMVLAALVACNLFLLHISAYRDLQVGGDPLITGRYLLPCVAVWAVTIAWVARSLPRTLGPALAGGLLACFALLDVGALALTAERFLG
jgi:4-amino-4-deoxy-L-arabinose transferase-like glycosyltransferase